MDLWLLSVLGKLHTIEHISKYLSPLIWLRLALDSEKTFGTTGLLLFLSYRASRPATICIICLMLQTGASEVQEGRFALAHLSDNLPVLLQSLCQTPLICAKLSPCHCTTDNTPGHRMALFGSIPAHCQASCSIFPIRSYFLLPMVVLSIDFAHCSARASTIETGPKY